MHTSNVTQKGQITVPAKLRRELGIMPGSKVRFVRKGRRVLIESVEEPAVESLFGVLKVSGKRAPVDIDAAIETAKHERARHLGHGTRT